MPDAVQTTPTTPLPLFDVGLPLNDAAPDAMNRILTAALHLNRARHGADPDYNRAEAQAAAREAVGSLQRYAGSRVSRCAMLGIVAHLVEVTAASLDPGAAGLE